MSPRQHPTGLTALASSALIIVVGRLGVDLTPEEAAIFIGLVSAVVSKFSPRAV